MHSSGLKPGLKHRDFERHRFIASVQQCTKKRFLALAPQYQLYPLLLKQEASSASCSHLMTQGSAVEIAPHGWLQKRFVDGSKLEKSGLTKQQKSCGYADNDDVIVGDLSPFLAQLFQRFQYAPVELDDLEINGNLSAVIALLCWANKWSLDHLYDLICEWLDKHKQTPDDLMNALIPILHQNDIYSLFMEKSKESGLIFIPQHSTVDENTALLVHTFNVESLINYHQDPDLKVCQYVGSDVSRLKALHRSKNDKVSNVIDQCLLELFSDLQTVISHNQAFLQAALLQNKTFVQDSVFESASDDDDESLAQQFTEQVKRLANVHHLTKIDIDQILEFLSHSKVIEFFAAIGASKSRLAVVNQLSE